MKSVLKWGCLGTIGLFVLLVVVAMLAPKKEPATTASVATAQPAAQQSNQAQPTATTQSATVAPTPKPASATAAPKPTNTPVPPTATPAPKNGTRQNPVPFKGAYRFQKGNQVYSVGVLEVMRNAWATVQKTNMFNTKPPDGNDYVLPHLVLVYEKGSEDQPMKTGDGGYKFYADNRFWGAGSVVGQEPKFTGQDVFPGGTVDGWLGGRYLPVELIEDAVLVYDDVYFALK